MNLSRRSAHALSSTLRLIQRFAILLLLGLPVLGVGEALAEPADQAEWTVMVYLNAKNNLESDGIENFYQMKSVKSSPAVNVVVEMGRPAKHYTNSDGPWSGVMRFKVTETTTPTAEHAVMKLGENGPSTNMGSATTLADFVQWGREKYPAKHFMLIIWNHGQGWRFQLSGDRSLRLEAASRQGGPRLGAAEAGQIPAPNGFRSVSYDEDTGSILYNRDIQDSLQKLLNGGKIDIIGFDACLMSMIETAYAMRNLGGVLVGSEELEPASGWPYKDWLASLAKTPTMDAATLGKTIVEAYRKKYGDSNLTTLSALDIGKASLAAASLTEFSNAAISKMPTEAINFRQARLKCKNYGESAQMQNPIDLANFLDQFSTVSKDPDLIGKAKAAAGQVRAAVLANYASQRLQGPYGSTGISIYFPVSKTAFESDRPDNQGYRLDNTVFPVEFVQKEQWAKLLQEYFKYR